MRETERSEPPGAAEGVETEAAFAAALRDLLVEAESNGIEVRGGWEVVPEGDDEGWDLEIVRLRR
jgi:hypothetical protein